MTNISGGIPGLTVEDFAAAGPWVAFGGTISGTNRPVYLYDATKGKLGLVPNLIFGGQLHLTESLLVVKDSASKIQVIRNADVNLDTAPPPP
jgi:hypothetical protein